MALAKEHKNFIVGDEDESEDLSEVSSAKEAVVASARVFLE